MALLHSFVRDLNTGRLASVDRMWAPAGRCRWYSSSPPGARLGERAYNRATMTAYLRSRVRRHERIVITKLGAGYDRKRQIINYGGKVLRRADDVPPRLLDFKGAADCVSGHPTLIVWSM